MNVYSTRTHGAFVQTKGSSILFNFGDSDPEFGAMQVRRSIIIISSSSTTTTITNTVIT